MAALALAGCAAKKPPPPPAAAPPSFAETPLPPSGTAMFEIGPIRDTRCDEGKAIFVEGTVRNTGSRASREVKVWVEGLDAHGVAIARAEALPTPQTTEPGTAATFLVRLPNDAAIRTFHVEAIGR